MKLYKIMEYIERRTDIRLLFRRRNASPVRAVVTAIIIQNGRILLARAEDAQRWTFAGGGSKRWWESRRRALRREMREELGADVSIVRVEDGPVIQAQGHPKDGDVLLYCYYVEISGTPSASCEIAEIDWFDYAGCQKLIREGNMTDASARVLERAEVRGYLS